MSETELTSQHRRRRLWPWVVGAVLLCLLAVGFSLWWPAYRVNQVVRLARTHQGFVYIVHRHPPWMNRFIAKDTFLPGYDAITHFYLTDLPITDGQFRIVCENSNLQSLELDVSNCSPESLTQLKQHMNLQRVRLHGCQQGEFPLDWVRSVRNGGSVEFYGLSVTPGRWPALLTARIARLGANEKGTSFDVSDDQARRLSLSQKHLTQTEADALVRIPDLKRLTLSFSTSTPEFWQTLSRHPELESLKIRSGSKTGPRMITGTELDQLAKLPSLSEVTIIDDVNKLELDADTCERFAEMRPDVSLVFYTAGTPPDLIPHVFGRQRE